MSKVLLVVIVVLVVAWWIVGRQRRVRPGDEAPRARAGGGAEEMVQCAHCGVHLPRGDAVAEGGLAYCSDVHRAAGPRER
jgi:uncharacterized protein